MSTLLYDLKANRLLNRTFFLHHLIICDNVMRLERRRFLFHKDEITISYSHVSQVNLNKDLFFAHLEIINTGGVENILIKNVKKRHGAEAKRIIDSIIHTTHGVYAPHHGQTGGAPQENKVSANNPTEQVIDEAALVRYKDLLNQGRLSKVEYNRLLQKHLRR
ncbi:hypothetical protein KJ605_02760 [Patescibacteria group bacterium]|nr:hypothetical protein [Patescibacteria group bacterium]